MLPGRPGLSCVQPVQSVLRIGPKYPGLFHTPLLNYSPSYSSTSLVNIPRTQFHSAKPLRSLFYGLGSA